MDGTTGQLADRRRSRRAHDRAEHGIVSVRVRPGHDAAVLNVSDRGMLIETMHRLLPGARVELHLRWSEDGATLAGRVIHASVCSVAVAGLRYRGAIVFDRTLPGRSPTPSGYAVPMQISGR